MTFEAILARCIEALERGESVDSCLAAWPSYADQLEPLLRIVGYLHGNRQIAGSPTSLANRHNFEALLASSVDAFEAGQSIESTLAMHPDDAERLEPLLRIVERTRGLTSPSAIPASDKALMAPVPLALIPFVEPKTPLPLKRMELVVASSQVRSTSPSQKSRRFYWPTMAMVGVAASFLLFASILFNGAAQSLPGDLLYPLKRGGETVQGAFAYAVGQPVAWHLSQIQRRLQELALMEAGGRTPDPGAVAQVNADVKQETEQALAQVAALPDDERQPLLAGLLTGIQGMHSELDENSRVATALAEPMATVQSALITESVEVAFAPTIAPINSEISMQEQASLPSQGQSTPNEDVVEVALPAGGPTSIGYSPTATATPHQPTATFTPRANGMAVTSPSPTVDQMGMGIMGLPDEGGAPDPSDLPATLMPAATPVAKAGATTSTPAALILLPTVTRSSAATPGGVATETTAETTTAMPTASATTTLTPTLAPALTSATPTPTVTNESQNGGSSAPTYAPTHTPTAAATALPLINVTGTPAQLDTPLPTATATPQPTSTPLPSATSTAEASETPLPTATSAPWPAEAPLPTPTFTPEPSNTPLPAATWTATPTDTPLPTATNTPQPTDTPLPTATWTATPTDPPPPTATNTPEPTDTPLPTATWTATSSPTATWTSAPTSTLEPTDTPTPEPTDTPLPTPTSPTPTGTAEATDTPGSE